MTRGSGREGGVPVDAERTGRLTKASIELTLGRSLSQWPRRGPRDTRVTHHIALVEGETASSVGPLP